MKLWSGRFEKSTDKLTDEFNASINFDCRLYKQDILGSIAHVQMLGKQDIIPQEEAKTIEKGLNLILEEIEKGKIQFDVSCEDIHMNIESLLIEKIGEVGKKLHTGRSRNDQVALDLRMYMKEQINTVQNNLKTLQSVLLNISKENLTTIIPGYTHMQKAQPITLAHHYMAYFEMFKRDIERLSDCYKRTNILPLGSGALASTTYPLDRSYVADLLGFDNITQNSLDAVSDRDFAIEFLSCASMIMMHLSRFSEEIILWNTNEFGFVEIDDAFSTGSSIMPQKKNPDIAELTRGKTGRVYGDLVSLLTTMKSLPLAYNKDMQEDKEVIFDAVDTLNITLPVFTEMIRTMKFNKEKMYLESGKGFTNATDAADYLVKKGVAFRDCHEIIGKIVLYCIKSNKSLEELTIDEYKTFSSIFDNDIYKAISLIECVNKRSITGGPSEETMKKIIERYQEIL
ncbi:MAG: argininosuccinate lyase [bacterium]